ncbi:flagellar assembly peptidoglycan hydrolase FlgJ [Alginatibacterium sediminis]|uniref:Peptidoglycan hydrolase FlgJ n=1 Tax=Alginatibacterium sediminis TaxID=2164068 RepID=A0A420EG38_9ALTE|nr:flagellar assembly peptidoglycan hydrolase FlgJ [Alginatibacterium sediminis]RKF19630.1 flagellar assembly peptidoglycan hydrolase FlgJ [Alginatibacterium sediminis]
MDKLGTNILNNSQNDSVFDLQSLDKLRSAAQKDPTAALQQVASQFEAMFMQMLMKQMRQGIEAFESDSPMNNQRVKQYTQMYDQQMSSDLSSSGALGLADVIVAQLDPSRQGDQNGASLRQSANLPPIPLEKTFNLLEQSTLGTNPALSLPISTNTEKSLTLNGELASKVPTINETNAFVAPARPSTEETAKGQTIIKRQNFASPKEFVEMLYPVAEKLAKQSGVSPLAIIAQAALETGWGKKVIANKDGSSSHNLFGIKADSRWKGDSSVVNTLEYRQGVAAQEKAAFRSYESLEESVSDYLKFIQGPRYTRAREVSADGAKYAIELQRAGYATDPNYANKIISIMNSKHLAQHREQAGEL